MRLGELVSQRPIVVALAGPNGAGKSSFFEAFLSQTEFEFVNADLLLLSLEIDASLAAEMADSLRRRLIRRRESFIFETVFSDPVGDQVDFLKQAEEAGYFVSLIFIGLAHPLLSADRVAMRASQDGHDMPAKAGRALSPHACQFEKGADRPRQCMGIRS